MTLKVIGAGFGRTGTLSTYTALNQLGFPCYHMLEVIENKENKGHLDFWCKVGRSPAGVQHDWDKVLSKYTATIDNPACCVWKELLVANPDAKVLLTLHPRGADAWYESTLDTIYFTEKLWQVKLLALFIPFMRKMSDMSHHLIWERNHKGSMKDRASAIAYYEQYAKDVQSSVQEDRLLVFSVDQGWEPLCQFLDVPVPDAPFPQVNDRAEVKKLIGGLIVTGYVTLAIGAALVLGVLFGLSKLLG